MANDSSTGGYIQPAAGDVPLADDDLDDVLQEMIVGITGLAQTLVRPRWQPIPPTQPDQDTDWCAFGVTTRSPDAYGAIVHDGTGSGMSQYLRHIDVDLLASFYGPNGHANAMLLRDGLQMPQNLEALGQYAIAFVGTDDIRPAPDLLDNLWVRRYDMTVSLRRQIKRTYPIKNILSAPVSIDRG